MKFLFLVCLWSGEQLGDQSLDICEESVQPRGPSIRSAFCRASAYSLNLDRRISITWLEACCVVAVVVLVQLLIQLQFFHCAHEDAAVGRAERGWRERGFSGVHS